MNKIDFLNGDTADFTAWLGEVIAGTKPLHFTYAPGTAGVDDTLAAAKNRYCWPKKMTVIDTPASVITLTRNSSLQRNQLVLDELSNGIRDCLAAKRPDEDALAGWVRAIMVWGGVYTETKNGGGNAGWLKENRATLAAYLTRILPALSDASGNLPNPEGDLRSNAGTTKVHALILADFVIYDSRVAAALAWLVKKWASEHDVSPVVEHLRFACMKANTSPSRSKPRSPDPDIFPYFAATGHIRNHRKHATWNLRANWVLRAALDKAIHSAGGKSALSFQSVRDVEAALFMMGENLEHALAAA
ncbi:MAG: hypothetical protein QFF03_23070 [Pseudomonadota bacterium]|nr:hypothetical protein [Pseudomonadota bacterium]